MNPPRSDYVRDLDAVLERLSLISVTVREALIRARAADDVDVIIQVEEQLDAEAEELAAIAHQSRLRRYERAGCKPVPGFSGPADMPGPPWVRPQYWPSAQ
jgi:hypothetical protein